MPAPALAGSTKAGTARSAASRNDDFMAVIEALHGGRLVQRNMNEIGEPTVKPVTGPGISVRISPLANIKSVLPIAAKVQLSRPFHGLSGV
jgi:hypothetical protein